MISHVSLGISDGARAFAFYDSVLAPLGLSLRFRDAAAGQAAWQAGEQERPLLFITPPFDGGPPHPGNGMMLALLAPDRAAVRRCHELALQQGGRCDGPPGLRPQYHPNYYGAYVHDPDGNKLCFVCHKPED
ncbi:VOC family protein [Pseudoroseomonas cervicalis]|uniref:VOC family protein n=1 Tax=Teichococcus cervicalis TaxID=204525 RepID=UPI00277FE00D|nr:VOC family protein [Pseudoroseomonas cervicalis]MDQ1081174.1 catechol 2,3-dioxygenase-like lactoylglutathione lyase family enzyme [Pseudoroseomonas cervicalis]